MHYSYSTVKGQRSRLLVSQQDNSSVSFNSRQDQASLENDVRHRVVPIVGVHISSQVLVGAEERRNDGE